MTFPVFYGLQQKPLPNTSLISQFQENVISFNFLANGLSSYIVMLFSLLFFLETDLGIKLKSSITVTNVVSRLGIQRRSQNRLKHLRWRVLQQQLMAKSR